eukprot:SAG31_NODE_562_length_14085_cov_164.582869_11_plen_57_part_00
MIAGSFKNGVLDVDAVFDSGQVIRYSGSIGIGMTWEGFVTVAVAGQNAKSFKHVGM